MSVHVGATPSTNRVPGAASDGSNIATRANFVVEFHTLHVELTDAVDSPLTDTPNDGPLPNNRHCSMYQLNFL